MATYQQRGGRWRAIVRIKGLAQQSRTFDTKGMARTWAERIEREYQERQARGIPESAAMTLGDAISWYKDNVGEGGRSKAADMRRLAASPLALEKITDLTVAKYLRHAERRKAEGAGTATVGNDFIWIRQVLKSARASLEVPADLSVLDDAVHELRTRRAIVKAKERSRRITADEELRLRDLFLRRDQRSGIPMFDVFCFALLTARRQEEITRLKWADLDPARGIAWLDDVKHPRHKVGNRRAFRMLKPAWDIVMRQPREADTVFPYNPRSIGTAFTRACHLLGIEDLHFHDLRHEATSRLFELGYSIQEVAQFTLHESWATLKRYTHLRPEHVTDRTIGEKP